MAMVGALSCISRNTMAFLALSLIRDTQSVSVVRRGYRASLHSPAGIWEDISIRNPEIAWTNGWSNSYTHNPTVSANLKWFVQFSLNIFLFYGLFKNSNNLEDEQKNYREIFFFCLHQSNISVKVRDLSWFYQMLLLFAETITSLLSWLSPQSHYRLLSFNLILITLKAGLDLGPGYVAETFYLTS